MPAGMKLSAAAMTAHKEAKEANATAEQNRIKAMFMRTGKFQTFQRGSLGAPLSQQQAAAVAAARGAGSFNQRNAPRKQRG